MITHLYKHQLGGHLLKYDVAKDKGILTHDHQVLLYVIIRGGSRLLKGGVPL